MANPKIEVASSELWGPVPEKITSPRCVMLLETSAQPVPIKKLDIRVDVHLSMAFVELECVFQVAKGTVPSKDRRGLCFVFELPTEHHASVTNAAIFLQSKEVVEALVVEDTPGLSGYRNREGRGMSVAMQLYRDRSGRVIGKFDPELFAIPFHGAKPGEEIKVVVKYLQNMEFYNKEFFLSIPLKFDPQFFTSEFQQQISLEYRISRVTDTATVGQTVGGSRSHELRQVNFEQPSVINPVLLYSRQENAKWPNKRLLLFYSVSAPNTILTSALCRKSLRDAKAKKGAPAEGVLSVFIAPPREQSLGLQPKDVVFILDRSGSMGFADVMDDANEALIQGLSELNPKDRFAICAFDDTQLWFAGALPKPSETEFNNFMARLTHNDAEQREESQVTTNQSLTRLQTPEDVSALTNGAPNVQEIARERNPLLMASEKNIARAKDWVKTIKPGGLTDIKTPLMQATYALHSFRTRDEIKTGISSDRVAMAFIITDGAVENERDICKFGQQIAGTTRLFTFGIGADCNAYFLRKLASIGRGYTDVALVRGNTKHQMSRLISHAQLPVLTDISLQLKCNTLTSCTWTPARTPDLFYDAPVMISLKYKGEIPDGTKLVISGKLSQGTKHQEAPGPEGSNEGVAQVTGGNVWSRTVTVMRTEAIPLQKVFAQQHVQELVADSWLADLNKPRGEELRRRAVEIATSESISCPFTQTIAAETTLEEYEARKMKEEEARANGVKPKRVQLNRFRGAVVFLGAVAVAGAFGAVMTTAMPVQAGTDAVVCCDDGDCDCDGCEEVCDGCDCIA